MKKRILLTFMLMNIIILALGSISVSAYTGTKYGDYLYYKIETNGEVTITDCVASATVIEIPTEIEGKKVTSIGSRAFDSCGSLTNITIPDGVITIGYRAFYQCNSLTSVTIPESVISIDDYAFRQCNKLTGITIPDSVTAIGECAFYQCNSLTSITIPPSVTEIGTSAFNGCKGLTSISISYGVPAIGNWVFYGCSSLTSVTIPNSVTSIGECAFYDCSSLTSITIPDSITKIDNNAFYQCNSLKKVNIPDIDKWCEIDFGGYFANPLYYGGKLYINNKVVTDAVITNKATKIGDYAFYNYRSLTSISISDGVISIGRNAFYGCSALTSITLPDSITSIGCYAFYQCYGLKRINISDIDKWCEIDFGSYDANPLYYEGVLYINNKVVTNAVITNKATKIGDYAFYNYRSLTRITIPDSVTSIGDYAFYGCSKLTSISIPDSVPAIGDYAFFGCSGLTSVTIPDSVTSIGDSAFSSCTNLTSVTFPDGVMTIGDYAFNYCSKLTSVTLPDSITRIGASAFSDCGSLTAVYISDLEAYLNCFYRNSNPMAHTTAVLYLNGKPLKGNLEIPSGVTQIPSYAFSGCTDLTSVTFPDSVMTIGDYAFYNCSGLTSVTFPDSVMTIGDCAFYNCSGLTSVTIPAGTTIIDNYAFCFCSNISAVFYTGTEEEWNEVYISYGNDPLNDAEKVYDVTKKTYKFETNCVNKLADVIGYYIDKMPVIENSGKTLAGWYDNKSLSGTPLSFPYYGTATTLYAAWTDKTGLSFNDAFTVKANMQYSVTTTESGQLIYYEFVPRLTGEYIFYSTGNLDTYGYLYDSNQRQLTSNDDGGNGSNFKLTYTLTAGETYYIAAKLYSGTGSFTLVTETDCVESTNTVCVTATTGEKIFITIPNYLPENASVILACYKNNALTEVMTAPNKNETLYFITKKDFDSAKVMVWNSLSDMTPICGVEIVKKN